MMSLLARSRTRLALIAIAMLALSLAACGGGGSGDEEATATSEGPEATATREAGGSAGTISVDQDFWHAGWKVSLGDASLAEDDFGTVAVTIDAVFENLSAQQGTFNSRLALTSGGIAYADESSENDLPNVPGGLTGRGVIGIQVDDGFSFDDAVLIVGNPDNNQALVPLTAGAGTLVSLEPREIAASGTASAGPLSFTVERAELRADLPDWSDEMPAGMLAMTVYFSATVGTGIPIGEGVLQGQHVALRLPDGTSVAVRSDGRSGVNELLQGKEGTTISDLSVRFEVNDPPEGAYAFIIRGPYGPGREMVEGEVTFQVP